MSQVRAKLLHLAGFLFRESDEQHPVSMQDILSYLARQDIRAERKAIYLDLETLREFGMDIQTRRRGRAAVYFVGERDFQLPELKLLVDSVQTAKFITEKKSLELIGKIEGLASRHQARQLHHEVLVRGRIKTMNESIYYNVDDISSAITNDSSVTFRYFNWDIRGNRAYRRNGARYLVSPWSLLWDDENYYLVAYEHESGLIRHYRVDKMSGIEQTGAPRQGQEVFGSIQLASYTDTHFGMFAGETQAVTLLFDNRLSGVVADRFGRSAVMIPADDGHFTVTVQAAVNVQFFGWLSGLGDQVKITAPAAVAEEMRKHIHSILNLYEP